MCIYIHNYTDSLTRFKQFTRVRIVKSRYYLKAIIKDKGEKMLLSSNYGGRH